MASILALFLLLNRVYSQTCAPNTSCTVKCTASYGSEGVCDNVIDGSDASFLSVECSYCRDKTIICPAGGCNITCSDVYGCDGATINADIAQSISNNVNVFCKGNSDCYRLMINAPFSNNVFIDCSIDTAPDYGTYTICKEVTRYLHTCGIFHCLYGIHTDESERIQCEHTHSFM